MLERACRELQLPLGYDQGLELLRSASQLYAGKRNRERGGGRWRGKGRVGQGGREGRGERRERGRERERKRTESGSNTLNRRRLPDSENRTLE
jgi:hypothetical protein